MRLSAKLATILRISQVGKKRVFVIAEFIC
jgi:hypothetical protein